MSIQNLSKFNDFDMINIENEIENTGFTEELRDSSLSTPGELLDKNYIRLQKYELTKKKIRDNQSTSRNK